jgi:hypothetical protein
LIVRAEADRLQQRGDINGGTIRTQEPDRARSGRFRVTLQHHDATIDHDQEIAARIDPGHPVLRRKRQVHDLAGLDLDPGLDARIRAARLRDPVLLARLNGLAGVGLGGHVFLILR